MCSFLSLTLVSALQSLEKPQEEEVYIPPMKYIYIYLFTLRHTKDKYTVVSFQLTIPLAKCLLCKVFFFGRSQIDSTSSWLRDSVTESWRVRHLTAFRLLGSLTNNRHKGNCSFMPKALIMPG